MENRSRWSLSPKVAQLMATTMRNGQENSLVGGYCSGTDAGAGPESTAGSEAVMIVLVRWT